MTTKFWSPEAEAFLIRHQRRDLVDRGNDLAERVAALMLTAHNRLDEYIKHGNLFNNKGGLGSLNGPESLSELEYFVNERLKQEIAALENVLEVFDEISNQNGIVVHFK
jgi:hypothetical protein